MGKVHLRYGLVYLKCNFEYTKYKFRGSKITQLKYNMFQVPKKHIYYTFRKYTWSIFFPPGNTYSKTNEN